MADRQPYLTSLSDLDLELELDYVQQNAATARFHADVYGDCGFQDGAADWEQALEEVEAEIARREGLTS